MGWDHTLVHGGEGGLIDARVVGSATPRARSLRVQHPQISQLVSNARAVVNHSHHARLDVIVDHVVLATAAEVQRDQVALGVVLALVRPASVSLEAAGVAEPAVDLMLTAALERVLVVLLLCWALVLRRCAPCTTANRPHALKGAARAAHHGALFVSRPWWLAQSASMKRWRAGCRPVIRAGGAGRARVRLAHHPGSTRFGHNAGEAKSQTQARESQVGTHRGSSPHAAHCLRCCARCSASALPTASPRVSSGASQMR